jgi:hypothetical protein
MKNHGNFVFMLLKSKTTVSYIRLFVFQMSVYPILLFL